MAGSEPGAGGKLSGAWAGGRLGGERISDASYIVAIVSSIGISFPRDIQELFELIPRSARDSGMADSGKVPFLVENVLIISRISQNTVAGGAVDSEAVSGVLLMIGIKAKQKGATEAKKEKASVRKL